MFQNIYRIFQIQKSRKTTNPQIQKSTNPENPQIQKSRNPKVLKSRNPDPYLGGHFILGYGSDNNQRIGAALNTPLSSKFMIRTGIFYSAGDGFRENLYLNRTNTNAIPKAGSI